MEWEAGCRQGAQQAPPPAEEESPLFATDDFRIWCMKVIPCTKRFVHDWTVCPFAHAGEKAVRRDPRVHEYTGIACPDMKKSGSCLRGERCPYAHNVFEYWLHPTRYRTQLCNDGPGCRRSICFFAHSLEELRVPACKPYVSPEALARASLEAIQANPHPLGMQAGTPPALLAQAAAQHAAQQAAQQAQGPPYEGGAQGPPKASRAALAQHAAQLANPRAASLDLGAGYRHHSHLQHPQRAASFDHGAAAAAAHSLRASSLDLSVGAAPPPPGAGLWQFPPGLPDGRRGSPDPLASRPSSGGDDDGGLAAALAGMKIALTHRAAGAPGAASNHDLVISTLHSLLHEAQAARQMALPAAGGAGGSASGSPPARVAWGQGVPPLPDHLGSVWAYDPSGQLPPRMAPQAPGAGAYPAKHGAGWSLPSPTSALGGRAQSAAGSGDTSAHSSSGRSSLETPELLDAGAWPAQAQARG